MIFWLAIGFSSPFNIKKNVYEPTSGGVGTLVNVKMYQFVEFVWFWFEKLEKISIDKSEMLKSFDNVELPSFTIES